MLKLVLSRERLAPKVLQVVERHERNDDELCVETARAHPQGLLKSTVAGAAKVLVPDGKGLPPNPMILIVVSTPACLQVLSKVIV